MRLRVWPDGFLHRVSQLEPQRIAHRWNGGDPSLPGGGGTRQSPVSPTADERVQPQTAPVPGGLPREVIILNNGSDIGAFWKQLKQPDLILIKPGTTAGPLAPAAPAAGSPRPRDQVVSAVKIRGRVDDDMANLQLEIDLTLLAPAEAWVPLGIDGPIIGSAREGEKELELRSTERGQWEVRLEGAGQHRLRFELKIPVNVSLDRKHLSMAIPEAPSTYVELDVPRPVQEVDVASGGSVGKTLIAGGKGTRLSAHLSPRSRVILDWTDEAISGSPPPPLLAAQVEIALDADLEAVTARSSWVIRCVRGIARKLEIRLDEQDVVQSLKFEDEFRVEGNEHSLLAIPLGEAMRPGDTRHLVLETRRTFPPNAPRTFGFSGFPLSNALEQSGAIGITQSANLWINVTTAQGLHRIDPRELPTELRSRPGIGTAYQFLDQPYKLALGIESSPPLYRSESLTRITLDAQTAQVDTTIQVHRVRGRLFEIEIVVPSALAIDFDRPRRPGGIGYSRCGPESRVRERPGSGDRPGTEDSSHALGSGPEIVFATAPGPAANRPRGSTAARAVCHPRRSFHRQHGFPVRRPRGDLRARRRARTAGCVKQRRVPASASHRLYGREPGGLTCGKVTDRRAQE